MPWEDGKEHNDAEGSVNSRQWEMVVGLEVHVQLLTRTKLFCNCSTDFGAPPNQNTCPVCLALPGALPVLNEHAVQLAARAAHALGCEVHAESIFARKNYFYPDLPKGYQISQFDRPLATGGHVALDESRFVRIHRIHMEEDAGKSIHDRYPGHTAIDLNRSGTPLIEIVSEPDLRSAADTGVYLKRLKQVLEYLEVSDANMEEGSLRVDANISIREKGQTALGTKTEIKNMNSFSGVERALEAEFRRQVALVESGGRVAQQTMLWDAHRSEVRPARSKEESHDYRYFPEPDLPPLRLTSEWLNAVRSEIPELPDARRKRFVDRLKLPAYDAEVLTADRALADYFEDVVAAHNDAKVAANWVRGEVMACMNEAGIGIDAVRVAPKQLGALLDLVRDGVVSNSAAKTIFTRMFESGEDAVAIADREGLRQVGDDGQLVAWIDQVLAANPEETRRFLAGEKKLLGVLVGQVMKASGGKADPKKVNRLLASRSEA
jgi:aspartyl-tRNA(Asn)/glutamyl-tRNA(Gln) amidotransferase subunit B